MTYRTLQLLIILTTIFSIPRFSVLHVPHKAILPSISSDGVISLASVTTQTHDVALPTRKSPFDTGQGLAIPISVSYTHLRAHETRHDLVCRLLLEKKKK